MPTTSSAPAVLEIPTPHVQLSALGWGPPDRPLAVLLHGYPDTAWTWRHLGPHLAALGWRVVAPFTRGYGPSAIPADGDFHVGALMADAVAIHGVLGGDSRAVLVGHDWGALTGNALGGHPDSPYSRIVSLAIPPLTAMDPQVLRVGPAARAVMLARQARRSWYIAFNQLPGLSDRTFDRVARRLWADWSPGYDATDDLEHLWASMPDAAHRGAALGYYRAMARPWRTPPQYRDWQRTFTSSPLVPTLCLHGRQDGALGADQVAGTEAVLPPGSRAVMVEHAGHFLHLEQPTLVNAAIADFLGPA